jgi:hypothetical protein
MEKHCVQCGKLKEHHGKGYCRRCYIKYSWKPKKVICKRCKKERPMHAKGLCTGCYQFVFQTEKIKEANYQRRLNIDSKTYKKVTAKCVICGFDKVVDLHHIDHNTKNNSENNLVGLCPNHHKMIHRFEYRKEILEKLKEKGFNTPKDAKLDFYLEN